MKSGRNAKRSPIHSRLEQQRAYFREVSGWESPAWYAPEGVEAKLDVDGRTGTSVFTSLFFSFSFLFWPIF